MIHTAWRAAASSTPTLPVIRPINSSIRKSSAACLAIKADSAEKTRAPVRYAKALLNDAFIRLPPSQELRTRSEARSSTIHHYEGERVRIESCDRSFAEELGMRAGTN